MRSSRSNHSRRHLAAALALAAGTLGVANAASAQQWTVINLHPTGLVNSEAHAIYGAQVVGVTGSSQGALLWTGSAPSMIRLDAQNGSAAAAKGVFDGRQGGSISVGTGVNSRNHAAIWSGTRNSMVDLHPGATVAIHTSVMAMGDGTQGGTFLAADGGGEGFSAGRPCMWSGTAESFVDLTPPGYFTGEVHGIHGDQQVGSTYDNFLGTAGMWYGTPESFVNLQPEEALFSAATATDGDHQYGVIGILDPIPGLFPCRWSGTAETFELLFTPDPENHWGEVHAAYNGFAAGYITDNDGISNSRACVWTGTEEADYTDIHQFVPAGLTESNALGVWQHEESGTTYVCGWGLRGSQREALLWVYSSGTNLITSPVAPADESAAPGQPLTYTVRVLNAGPVASNPTTLTITLPPAATATYSTASPAPASVTATQVTFDLGTVAGSGGFTDVSITLTAVGSGANATITAEASSATEVDPSNNTVKASSRIQTVACAADLGVAGGLPGNDGVLDNNDFIAFINYFFDQNALADMGIAGGFAGHDGQFDNNDFIAFINAFFDGC